MFTPPPKKNYVVFGGVTFGAIFFLKHFSHIYLIFLETVWLYGSPEQKIKRFKLVLTNWRHFEWKVFHFFCSFWQNSSGWYPRQNSTLEAKKDGPQEWLYFSTNLRGDRKWRQTFVYDCGGLLTCIFCETGLLRWIAPHEMHYAS